MAQLTSSGFERCGLHQQTEPAISSQRHGQGGQGDEAERGKLALYQCFESTLLTEGLALGLSRGHAVICRRVEDPAVQEGRVPPRCAGAGPDRPGRVRELP